MLALTGTDRHAKGQHIAALTSVFSFQYRRSVRIVVLLREALSSEKTPFAKLLRLAKNNGSSTTRPASPQLSGVVDPQHYHMNRKLTPTERADLAEQYRTGMSAMELARQYNVHRQTIARQLKLEGVVLRPKQKRTPELTEQAIKLYADGHSLDDIAEQLNVQASTINRALVRAGVTLRPPVANRWHLSRDE